MRAWFEQRGARPWWVGSWGVWMDPWSRLVSLSRQGRPKAEQIDPLKEPGKQTRPAMKWLDCSWESWTEKSSTRVGLFHSPRSKQEELNLACLIIACIFGQRRCSRLPLQRMQEAEPPLPCSRFRMKTSSRTPELK